MVSSNRCLFGLLLALVLPMIGVISCARADDWPEFRGPTGQGHFAGKLPMEWGPVKNVAWKQKIPGRGWSSPVICKDRVFVTTAVPVVGGGPKDVSLRVLCLDAATGKIVWDVEALNRPGAGVPKHHIKNSNASPTPIVDSKRLFVHFGHLGIACLDLEGKVLWRNTDLKYVPVHGNGGSPILVDDLLIFNVDGFDKQVVMAVAADSGKLKWQTDRKCEAVKKFAYCTPLLIEVNGQRQIISPGSNMVAAYDPKTGAEIWRLRYEGYSVVPRPVFGHGLVFMSTSYDDPTLLAIRPDGKGDVTNTHLAWSRKQGAPLTPSPLLIGAELYVISDDGVATCLDAKTGNPHWEKRLDGAFSASPLLAGGKIYFQSEEGTGYVIKASTKFELLARNDLDERSLASSAAAGGALFLRTAEHLYKIEQAQP